MILPEKFVAKWFRKSQPAAEKPIQTVRSRLDLTTREGSRPWILTKEKKNPSSADHGAGISQGFSVGQRGAPINGESPQSGGCLSAQLQRGSGAGGVFPWSLEGTFPFGGPLTDGPLTPGAAAAGAAGAAAAPAGADGLALAPGATLPGFGTP